MKYTTTVFMGRMQPLHNGHLYCIQTAIDKAKQNVVIVLGTAYQSTTYDNPLSDEVRIKMVRDCIMELPNVTKIDEYTEYTENLYSVVLSTGRKLNLFIHLVRDLPYDGDAWETIVDSLVPKTGTIAQVGCVKASDTDVVDHHINSMFKDWDFINVGELTDGNGDVMSSSNIRSEIYETLSVPDVKYMPRASLNILKRSMSIKYLSGLSHEYNYIKEYPTIWGKGPFDAGDAVVIHKGNVLLIGRGNYPGKGLMALPGGFKDGDESDVQNALRELYEETNLHVPETLVTGTHTFNRGKRSKRNIISNTSIIYLPDGYDISGVTAGDDATYVEWFKLSRLEDVRLFSDHLDIINFMLKNYKE